MARVVIEDIEVMCVIADGGPTGGPGGEYERRKLLDWQDRVDEIAATFDAMVPAAELDSTRPSVEFYRNSRELILLQPVR